MSSPYKPPRASPFSRASPSPLRQSTPSPSPTKVMSVNTPSRTYHTPATETTPRGFLQTPREVPSSPTRAPKPSPSFGPLLASRNVADNNALSKLQPAQVRELREGFQLLDRDSDGLVGRDDVVDMLTQLGTYCASKRTYPKAKANECVTGLPSGNSDITPFFPPGSSQSINLPTYLNSIATLLASLSPPNELMSAFAAFDEDDSGQVDLKELRDALLNTAPDAGEQPLTAKEVDTVMGKYTSRRAFGKNMSGMGKRGEVFKYQEFVGSLAGAANNTKDEKENEE